MASKRVKNLPKNVDTTQVIKTTFLALQNLILATRYLSQSKGTLAQGALDEATAQIMSVTETKKAA